MSLKLLLIAISGSREGESFQVEPGETCSFGRTQKADIAFETDGHMSGVHFEIHNSGDFAEVRDRGSTNGTWLNNTRVAQDKLRDGDRVRAGTTILTVEYVGTHVGSGTAIPLDDSEDTQRRTMCRPTSPPASESDSAASPEVKTEKAPITNRVEEENPAAIAPVASQQNAVASNPFESVDEAHIQTDTPETSCNSQLRAYRQYSFLGFDFRCTARATANRRILSSQAKSE